MITDYVTVTMARRMHRILAPSGIKGANASHCPAQTFPEINI